MKNITLIFIVTVIWASCKIPDAVVKPVGDMPNAYISQGPDNSAESIANLPLSSFFHHPAMLKLIDTALAKNTDIQVALKNIDAAKELLKTARLANLPQLNLAVSATSNRPSDNSLNGLSASQFLQTRHIEDFNANLTLSWEADIWGKINQQKNSALYGFLQSQEVKKAVQTQIVANVANSFYRLLMLDAQSDVARSNIELANRTVKMIRLQFDAGQVTSLAVQQAEAQQLRAAQLIPQLDREIVIQENILNALSGTFPSPVERAATLAEITVPTGLSTGLPADLLQLRPDVKSMELALNIANTKVGIANARLYPSLVISATGGLNAFKASNWFNIPASLFGVVGGGITQPIFQHRQLKAQFELAKIEREKTVLQFRQTMIDAVAEVSNEQTKMLQLDNEYQIALNRVKTLQTAVKNADMLFKSGLANYLEVINAQGNLLQGELELTGLKTAQLQASVNLYRALGGGWK